MRELMLIQFWVMPMKLLVPSLMHEALRNIPARQPRGREVVVEASLMLYFIRRLYGIGFSAIYRASFSAFPSPRCSGLVPWLARHFLIGVVPGGYLRSPSRRRC